MVGVSLITYLQVQFVQLHGLHLHLSLLHFGFMIITSFLETWL